MPSSTRRTPSPTPGPIDTTSEQDLVIDVLAEFHASIEVGVPGPVTGYVIATCYDHLGRHAATWQINTDGRSYNLRTGERRPAPVEDAEPSDRDFGYVPGEDAECPGHYDDDATLTSGVGIGEATYCDGSCQRAGQRR